MKTLKKVVIAPDSFKESLSALEVDDAIECGFLAKSSNRCCILSYQWRMAGMARWNLWLWLPTVKNCRTQGDRAAGVAGTGVLRTTGRLRNHGD